MTTSSMLTTAGLASPGTAMGYASTRSGRARGLRPLLIRDHERLDALFVKLLDEFVEGDPSDVRAMWSRFEEGLSAHLDAEERYLLPLFAGAEPAEAAALLAEHSAFRRALDHLGVGVDLHAVSLDVVRELVEALRAHARRENQLFYRWAELRIGRSGRDALAREIGLTRTPAVEGPASGSARPT